MKKTILFLVIGIIAVVAVVLFTRGGGPAPGGSSAGTGQAQPADTVFALSFKDYQGKTVRLADFRGRPLVVNSWASWCPFCRKELPDFRTVQKELDDKVTFIAIDRAEPLATAKKYTDALGVTGDLAFLLDSDDAFYSAIGGFSMPETVFIDKNGVIRDHKRGPMEVGEIRERTRAILSEAGTPSAAEQPKTSTAPGAIRESSAAHTLAVTYTGNGFSPSSITIKAGDTVVFTNRSAGPLWVASAPHPTHTDYSEFDAREGVGPGRTYAFTFARAGRWGYHNHLKASDRGVVIVEQ